MRTYLLLIIFLHLILGCKHQAANSDIKITNADQTDRFPAVFQLIFKPTYSSCTATAIAPNVALTAAHCLCEEEASNIFALYYGDKDSKKIRKAIRYYSNEGHECKNLSELPTWHSTQRDVAVIEFDGVFAHTSAISTRAIEKGDSVILVGYGNTHQDEQGNQFGSGVKRSGKNIYRGHGRTRKMIRIIGDAFKKGDQRNIGKTGENVAALKGDSGSPLIASDKGIVGVLQGGRKKKSQEISYYADLFLADNRDFLRKALKKGYQMPATCCACTKNYYEGFIPIFNHFGKVREVPEVEVGDNNNNRLCQTLKTPNISVSAEDQFYREGARRYYQLEDCVLSKKQFCENAFKIKMLGD